MLTAIETLFHKVAMSGGITRPSLRAAGLVFKLAPAHGRNAGAIYVNDIATDVYLGKIHNGNFVIPARYLDIVHAIAKEPQIHAIKYGRATGHCSICGRQLVDPVSVHNAIGPICADKLGIMLEAPNTLTKQGNLLDLL